jgi:hypothetical protein
MKPNLTKEMAVVKCCMYNICCLMIWQYNGTLAGTAVMEAKHAVLNTSGRRQASRLAYHWLSGVSAQLLPSRQPESCHMLQTGPALWTSDKILALRFTHYI